MAESENGFSLDGLLAGEGPEPDFVVDGVHFGRGSFFKDPHSEEVQEHETVDVTFWRIIGDKLEKLGAFDQFTIEDSCMVRRMYRSGGNEISRIYFYWRGSRAAKGLSPLCDDSEEENPPVERVTQWSEPPAFLQLFDGRFIVHLVHEEEAKVRLYMLRGEVENEVHLFEVPAKSESLRSRTSFVIRTGGFDGKKASIVVWHGSKSPAHSREVIKNIARYLAGEIKTTTCREVEEGCSEEVEWFGPKENSSKESLSSNPMQASPRLFYCNTITGTFMASEIEYPHKSAHVTPFPFLQEHLYSAPQPAIFLLVDGGELWIWQGCAAAEDVEVDESRLKSELKTTIQAALGYSKKKAVYFVHAGVEPDDFVALFPFWIEKRNVAQLQLKRGRIVGGKSVIDENTRLE